MPKEPSNRHSAYNALFIFSEFFSTSIKWAVAAVLLGFVFNKDFEKNKEVTATFFSALGVGVIDSMLRLRFSSYKHYIRMPLDLLFEYSESFAISYIAMSQTFRWSRPLSLTMAALFSLFPTLIEFDVYMHFQQKIQHIYNVAASAFMRSLVLLTLFVVVNNFYDNPPIHNKVSIASFSAWLGADALSQIILAYTFAKKANNTYHTANSIYELVSIFLLSFEAFNELVVEFSDNDNFSNGYFALTGLLAFIVAAIRGFEQFNKPQAYGDDNHDQANNDAIPFEDLEHDAEIDFSSDYVAMSDNDNDHSYSRANRAKFFRALVSPHSIKKNVKARNDHVQHHNAYNRRA